MVTLIPRKGLQKPSVRTIFFRASYTLLYWALGSGCKLCILVCNKAHEGRGLSYLSLMQHAQAIELKSYKTSKIIRGVNNLVPGCTRAGATALFIHTLPARPARLTPRSHCNTKTLRGCSDKRSAEGSVTSALVYAWKVKGIKLAQLFKRLGEEIQLGL